MNCRKETIAGIFAMIMQVIVTLQLVLIFCVFLRKKEEKLHKRNY